MSDRAASPQPSSTSTVNAGISADLERSNSVSNNGSPKRSSKRIPVPNIEDHWTGAPPPEVPTVGSARIESETFDDHDAEKEIEVEWDNNDPQNPQNFTKAKKWRFTILASVLTVVVTFASSAPSSSIRAVAAEFDASTEVCQLITSLFLCGVSLTPFLVAVPVTLMCRFAVRSGSTGMGTRIGTRGQKTHLHHIASSLYHLQPDGRFGPESGLPVDRALPTRM